MRVNKEKKTFSSAGQAPWWKHLLGWVCLILGELVLAALYINLLAVISNMVLRIIVIAGVVGGSVAWIVFWLQQMQIRRKGMRILFTVVGLFVLYYTKWALYTNLVEDAWVIGSEQFWHHHFVWPDYLTRWAYRVVRPDLIVQMMGEVLYRGFLSINGEILKGAWLAIVWVGEFIILAILPFWRVNRRMSVPYDEEQHIWLNREEEWMVTYLKDYRALRPLLNNKDAGALQRMLDNTEAYRVKGKESYGILTFFRKGKKIGPYISLMNVKAVQRGPKRLQYQYVPIVKKYDIGAEVAAALYEKISTKAEQEGHGGKKDYMQFFHELKMQLTVDWSEWKEKLFPHKEEPEEVKEYYEDGEEVVSVEDATVFVPRVTPEMEENYRKMKNKE